MNPELTILMPVFNERGTIEAAIADALGAELPVAARQLVIIDDGSTDGTREWLAAASLPDNVEVVLHEKNQGKGAAIRTGLQHARGTYSAILDADLEYAAADLGPVLEPLLAGKAKVVFGTRAWTSQSSFSFWYVMGNKSVTMATNVLYNCWISDVMTCHKAMSTELFRSLRLRERGFAIEPEIAARVLQSGARIYGAIGYAARSSADESKSVSTSRSSRGQLHRQRSPDLGATTAARSRGSVRVARVVRARDADPESETRRKLVLDGRHRQASRCSSCCSSSPAP